MRTLLLAAMLGCSAVVGAHAATVDTFSFTQVGWDDATEGSVVSAGAPDPGGLLSGSFTGTVEPGGFIQLADLSAFSALFTDTVRPFGLAGSGMNRFNLSAFSYLTTGGASSLDIAPLRPLGGDCVGGAVPFSPDCTTLFSFSYTPGINGAVFAPIVAFPSFVTTEQPVITLISSVTTTSTPEPSALSLFASFVALLVAARLIHRRSAKGG